MKLDSKTCMKLVKRLSELRARGHAADYELAKFCHGIQERHCGGADQKLSGWLKKAGGLRHGTAWAYVKNAGAFAVIPDKEVWEALGRYQVRRIAAVSTKRKRDRIIRRVLSLVAKGPGPAL
jgi:hypothetical protein